MTTMSMKVSMYRTKKMKNKEEEEVGEEEFGVGSLTSGLRH